MGLIGAILLAIYVVPPVWRIPVVVAGAAIEVGESLFWIRLSKRRRATVGVETLVGMRGVVVRACRPVGQVRVNGELWRARCEGEGADPGEEVVVDAVSGLELAVSRSGFRAPRWPPR